MNLAKCSLLGEPWVLFLNSGHCPAKSGRPQGGKEIPLAWESEPPLLSAIPLIGIAEPQFFSCSMGSLSLMLSEALPTPVACLIPLLLPPPGPHV